MLDTSKRTGRLVQLGTQGCTEPRVSRSAQDRGDGRPRPAPLAQASYCRNNPLGEWNYEIDPVANETTVDWRQWLGPAPKRHWSPERLLPLEEVLGLRHGGDRRSPPSPPRALMMAMNIEEYPQTVSCVGGNLCDTDKGPDKDGKPYGERREVADTQLLLVQFPSGISFFLVSDTVNERGVEDVIRGQRPTSPWAAARWSSSPSGLLRRHRAQGRDCDGAGAQPREPREELPRGAPRQREASTRRWSSARAFRRSCPWPRRRTASRSWSGSMRRGGR